MDKAEHNIVNSPATFARSWRFSFVEERERRDAEVVAERIGP
ncbi:MAG: hypothetical protein RLZZ347_399 [Candidatus Parcubacteria bacterium]|jgi:hypothetical protein